MTGKPDFYLPDKAAAFQDPTVVAAYGLRPPYPDELYDRLAGLIVDEPRAVLDLGCGPGNIARRMVAVAARVDAVDVSEPMLALGRRLPGGDSPKLRWVLGRAEDAPIEPSYSLVTAAASMHWMDWEVVLPRVGDILTPGGVVALVNDGNERPPWYDAFVKIIVRYTVNPTLDITYRWIDDVERRGLFRRIGEVRIGPILFRQSVADYVESFHARASCPRGRMGAERAAGFDRDLTALVREHVGDGPVELQTITTLIWGRPTYTRQ